MLEPLEEFMNTKNKIFVSLAFIAAALYTLDILRLINQGRVVFAFIKACIVAILLYYAITQIKKAKALKTSQTDVPK